MMCVVQSHVESCLTFFRKFFPDELNELAWEKTKQFCPHLLDMPNKFMGDQSDVEQGPMFVTPSHVTLHLSAHFLYSHLVSSSRG